MPNYNFSHNVHNTKTLSIILLALCILSLYSCSEPVPAEEQIKQKFIQAKTGIEEYKSEPISEILAPDFKAFNGDKSTSRYTGGEKFDIKQLKRTLMGLALRKEKIGIKLGPMSVTMDEFNSTLASMETTALLTAGRGLLPDDGKLYKVTSKWRSYDGEWLLTDISWK